ncbi:MAG: tetratricopeptide repeat protein [Spirochaetales bacterium]|nr:tetratricopeptide repeat protein [Spirochaetales bacterium]
MKKTKSHLLLFVFVILSVLGFGQESDRQLFRLAEQRLESGAFGLAIRSFRQLIEENPGSPYLPDAQARLGIAYFGRGDLDLAREQFRRVEARYRSSAYFSVMPLWIGLVHYEKGEFPQAVGELERFLLAADPEISRGSGNTPQVLQAKVLLYRSYLALEQKERATDVLESLYGPDKRFPDLVYELYTSIPGEMATVYLELQDFIPLANLLSGVEEERLTEADQRLLTFAKAELRLYEEVLPEAQELYRALLGRGDRFSGLAYQRLFQAAEASNDREEQERIIRSAETDLGRNLEILVPFWLRVGQISYTTRQFEISELYLLKIWDTRERRPIPAEAVLLLSRLAQETQNIPRALGFLETYLENQAEPDIRVLLKAAELHLLEGNPTKALSFLGDFLQPDQIQSTRVLEDFYSQGFYLAAAGLFELDRYDEAYALITAVLGQSREGSFTPEFLEYRGRIELYQGNRTQAISSFRQHLTLRPTNYRVASAYLRTLLEQNNPRQAFEEGQRILALGENDRLRESFNRGYTEIQYQAALGGLNSGNLDGALELLNALPELKENSPDWYRSLYPSVSYYRGWTAYQQQRDQQAIEYFQTLLDLDSDHPQAQEAAYLSGWASFRLGNYSAAAGFFQGAALWSPDQGLAEGSQILLARTNRANNNTRQALEIYRQIWDNFPNHKFRVDAQFERGQLLAELGQTQEAASVYTELFRAYPGHQLAPIAAFRKGEVLLSAGSFEASREAFAEYREAFPQHSWMDGALFQLGEASFGLGEGGAATLFWQRLANDFRRSSYRFEALRRTAEVFENQGDRNRALSIYNELLGVYPRESEARELPQKVRELNFVLAGFSEREAELRASIEQEGGVSSPRGKTLILELSELLILEQQVQSIGSLQGDLEIILSQETPGTQPARAAYLLGEYRTILGQEEGAGALFLQAARLAGSDDSQTPVYYLRSIEVLIAQNRIGDARVVFDEMRSTFPGHELTTRGQNLVSPGRN